MRHCLIAYDVRENRSRAAIARLLEKEGERLQKSLFLVRGSPEKLKRLERELQEMLGESDSLLVLPLCRHCLAEGEFYGSAPPLLLIL